MRTTFKRDLEELTQIAALFFLIWFVGVTWPWCLLLIPVGIVVLLLLKPNLRKRIAACFLDSELPPEAEGFRKKLRRLFVGLFLLTAIICAIVAGRDRLAWWLIPLLCSIAMLRLYALSIHHGRLIGLRRALCKNLCELLLITAAVLALYAIAQFFFQKIAFDDVTLSRLIAWEGRVESTHKFLEAHKPTFWELFLVVMIVSILRISGQVSPKAKYIAALGPATGKTFKWSQRISCAVAVAASLTFLATDETGPTRRIQATLKDANQEYKQFQTTLSDHIDPLLRRALLWKAWSERPGRLKSEMRQAAEFQNKRAEFEREAKRATAVFQVPSSQEPFPSSVPITQRYVSTNIEEEEPSLQWTLRDLRKATSSFSSASLESNPSEAEEKPEEDESDEVAKQAFFELSGGDKLFDRGALGLIQEHYPVFGEFLDAVGSSVSETVFDAIRTRIVRSVSSRRPTRVENDTLTLVSQQITLEMGTVQFDWNRFDESWQRSTASELKQHLSELTQAELDLQNAARKKRSDLVTSLEKFQRDDENLLAKALTATNADKQSDEVANIQALYRELKGLEKTWPLLRDPQKEQTERLSKIEERVSKFLREHGSLAPVPVAPELIIKVPFSQNLRIQNTLGTTAAAVNDPNQRVLRRLRDYSLIPAWTNPYDGFNFFRAYCIRRVVEIIASPHTTTETAALESALGDDYVAYDKLRERLVEREKIEIKIETARQQAEVDRWVREELSRIRTEQKEHEFEREYR